MVYLHQNAPADLLQEGPSNRHRPTSLRSLGLFFVPTFDGPGTTDPHKNTTSRQLERSSLKRAHATGPSAMVCLAQRPTVSHCTASRRPGSLHYIFSLGRLALSGAKSTNP